MADARSQLLSVLQEAASQDYTRMRQAEELLKQWENEPRFFATLQDIFYDPSVNHDVRFLGGIYLKNGVSRFWRKTAKHPILPEEKVVIRQRLLQFLIEPSKKLTAQNAVIVARIARMDYPMEWPELLPSLIQTIENTNSQTQEQTLIIHDRAFEMLYEVLQELSTRLLSAGRRQFAEIAPRVFQTVANSYVAYTSRTIQNVFNTASGIYARDDLMTEMGIVSASVKCLRILMVSGIKDVHKYDETKTLIDLSGQRLQDYVDIRTQMAVTNNVDEACRVIVEAIIEDHGAMYLGLQKTHPVSCILCPAWTDILSYYWQHIMQEGNRLADRYKTDAPIFETFLLQGMLLVKDTIKNSAYNVDDTSSDTLSVTEEEKQLAMEARNIVHSRFITTDFVHACAETLVSKYMLLTPADMEKWEEDPEGWANAVDSESWEFELRPCAEMTFMSLLSQYRDQLTPILLDLVEKVANVSNFEELLFKDAVYAAVGLGVQSIYGRLDFETLVTNRLLPEIRNKEPSFKILRRRIAWLLGKWVNEGISADCRISIYEGLLSLMMDESDLVVRLTAAHSLRLAIDDWDFEISILLPYLGTAMDLLLKLVNEVEESDTVMKLISDLNVITDRTGSHMSPYASKIIELLVPHWSRAQEEPLFQSALVATFTKIVGVLKEQSFHVQGLFLPIVRYCVDLNNSAHVYLLEDGLDLWWTLLQTAAGESASLFELLPVAVNLLDYDTEGQRKVLKIIESYLLLNPATTLQQCALPLFAKLGLYVGSSKLDVATSISHTAELALQSCPVSFYAEPLIQSGLLEKVLTVLLEDQMYAHAIMAYMNLYARLAVCDAQFLLNYLAMAAQQLGAYAAGDFVGQVLDKWMDKFDNIGHSRARKLTCMAFTSLLRTNDLVILNRLAGIMAIWTDVLSEVQEAEEDAFLYPEVDMQTDIAELDESAERSRKKELREKDLVYTTDLTDMVRQVLFECENKNGGAQQFQQQYLSKVDPTLLSQVQKALSHQ